MFTDWIGPSIQSLDAARQQWWNYQEARHVERFGSQQANTAMQRRVADLRAAGLNPMLAIDQGGASSAPGVAAPGVSADIGGAISSALAMKRLDADISQINQNIENMKKAGVKLDAETGLTEQLVKESEARTKQTGVSTAIQAAGLPKAQTMEKLWSIPETVKNYFQGSSAKSQSERKSTPFGQFMENLLKGTTFGEKIDEGSVGQ